MVEIARSLTKGERFGHMSQMQLLHMENFFFRCFVSGVRTYP